MADTPHPPPLPPEVAAAWGLTPAPSRGPRAELTLDRIVGTAIRLGDEHGLAAVSMTRVASELGFTTMSLYRHVPAKEALLAHVQDAAMGAAPHAETSGLDWRDGLTVWTRQLMAAYSAHPWVLRIPIKVPPLMPRSIEWLDLALQLLDPLELSAAERLSTVLLLSGYARNEATLAASIEESSRSGTSDDRDYEAALRHLVAQRSLPGLAAMLGRGGLFDHPAEDEPDDPDDFMVSYGLARLLDGIESLVTRRR